MNAFDSQVSIDLGVVKFWTWTIAYALAAFAIWSTRNRNRIAPFTRRGVAIAIAIVLVAALAPQGLGRVQIGARGIVLRFGAPTGQLLGEGLYYVIPLVDHVTQVNVQTNTIAIDRAQGVCADLEPVYADLAITFHVVPARAIDVYRSLRFDYADRIVRPAVADAWKETVAHYSAGDVIAKRSALQRAFRTALATRVEHFGLAVDALATTRFNFAFAYAQAAQMKVAAVQRTLQAQQDLQRIRFESQQGVIRARSEVEALKLQRNIPIEQLMRMRELDLRRRAIDKWDGHLPQTTTGIPFVGAEVRRSS